MGSRNDDDEGFVRVRCPVPGSSTRSHGRGLPLLVGSVDGGFAAVMAQVRRPVPFRTRKLRPGAAMVLHSEGCGRVARRRIQTCLAGSPDGDPAFFVARGRGTDVVVECVGEVIEVLFPPDQNRRSHTGSWGLSGVCKFVESLPDDPFAAGGISTGIVDQYEDSVI